MPGLWEKGLWGHHEGGPPRGSKCHWRTLHLCARELRTRRWRWLLIGILISANHTLMMWPVFFDYLADHREIGYSEAPFGLIMADLKCSGGIGSQKRCPWSAPGAFGPAFGRLPSDQFPLWTENDPGPSQTFWSNMVLRDESSAWLFVAFCCIVAFLLLPDPFFNWLIVAVGSRLCHRAQEWFWHSHGRCCHELSSGSRFEIKCELKLHIQSSLPEWSSVAILK